MKTNNKKWIYPLINILLYAVGFPILFVAALIKSLEWNSYGMYGVSSFAPLIAVAIVAVLVLGIQAIIYVLSKKKGKTGKSLTVKMLAVPVAVIVGLFGIVDIAMPTLLKDATSNTILYEDVVDDYQGMHEKLMNKVELFKEKNGLDESVKYSDEEFQNIFKPLFASMDKAYYAFDPLAIEIALDQPDLIQAILNGNFPLEVAVTLILRTSDIENANNHSGLSLDELVAYNLSEMLTAVKTLTANGLQNIDASVINDAINQILVYKEFDGIRWNIFQILGNNIIVPEFDPNAHIVQYTYDEAGNVIGTKDMGACLGYQDMSWLNGIPQMFFIPLMSVRELFYVFAAIIAFTTVIQFFVADAYQRKFDTKFALLCITK